MELIEPDRAALEHVHGHMHMLTSLDKALENPVLNKVIKDVARWYMERRERGDVKTLQAAPLPAADGA